ncbi:alpha/beta hydrolase [Pseudacidovorax intermedius]|uniref:alpha/beta hydrolase family protein n=1 Tax=Pseudacidovorax intermedius TaxID=433924 RepID=UPI00128EC3B2|nr:alpha/beta hydrolase [Pseudacidovorax intermedius]
MKLSHLRLPIACLALLSLGAAAQTTWPDYMAQLRAGPSESAVQAMLPDDSRPQPDPALAPDLARWQGVWKGWACFLRRCDIAIAVDKLTPEGATVDYAAGNAQQGRINAHAEGRFQDGELSVRLHTGARLALRLRSDGDMEMSVWKPDTQLLSAGVLSRNPLASPYARHVERVATPWTDDAGRPQTLEMVVYRPRGTGPFPTVLMNHGSTGMGRDPALFGLTWASPEIGEYFAARGWQVLFPQRRGRGGSDGVYDEGFSADRAQGYSCDAGSATAGFDRAMQDLEVVLAHVQTRPDVDARRLLVGGVSRGGILAVALAGAHPERFEGVVNFVGGWIGQGCKTAPTINPALMQRGAAFEGPMLWLYGDQDPYYRLSHSRANFDAFLQAGGRGEFLSFRPPAGMNGHMIFLSPGLWSEALDNYLARVDRR